MFTIEDYLNAKKIGAKYAGKPASHRTLLAYGNALHVIERLLGKSLAEMDEHDGDRLMQQMENEGFVNAYKAVILAAARGAFTWAIAMDRYNGRHPFEGISTPVASRKIPTILTKSQIKKFFASFTSEKYRLFYELMYYGGLRIGEVCTLRHSDIREDGIVVRGKGDKDRYIYLPDTLLSRLRSHISTYTTSSYVFSGQGPNAKPDYPITRDEAYRQFHNAARLSKMPEGLHPHNLRHSSATHFHASTGDLAMTQKWLGHARPETTVIYAQIADEQMKHAAKKVFG